MITAAMRDAGIRAHRELAAGGATPALLEQYRIDRLLELRAVIDSIRTGQDSPVFVRERLLSPAR